MNDDIRNRIRYEMSKVCDPKNSHALCVRSDVAKALIEKEMWIDGCCLPIIIDDTIVEHNLLDGTFLSNIYIVVTGKKYDFIGEAFGL